MMHTPNDYGRRSRSRHCRTIGVILAGILTLAGCTPSETRSIGADAESVTAVDLYFYDADAPADGPVTHTTIEDFGLIVELVDAFTDMPVDEVTNPSEDAAEARVTALRFTWEDGSGSVLFQYFVEPENVVIAWPDGAVTHTTWGVPLADYYADLGPSETVDGSARPSSPLDQPSRH